MAVPTLSKLEAFVILAILCIDWVILIMCSCDDGMEFLYTFYFFFQYPPANKYSRGICVKRDLAGVGGEWRP